MFGGLMKRYSIMISDPKVQYWFNVLFDEAKLSSTIEQLARNHMDTVQGEFFDCLMNFTEKQQKSLLNRMGKKSQDYFKNLKSIYERR
jgi:exonuclease V gamma subunit